MAVDLYMKEKISTLSEAKFKGEIYIFRSTNKAANKA